MRQQRQRQATTAQTRNQTALTRLLIAVAMAAMTMMSMMAMARATTKAKAAVTVPIQNQTSGALKVEICEPLSRNNRSKVGELCWSYTIKPGKTKEVSCMSTNRTSCVAQIHYGGTIRKQTLRAGHVYQVATAATPKKPKASAN